MSDAVARSRTATSGRTVRAAAGLLLLAVLSAGLAGASPKRGAAAADPEATGPAAAQTTLRVGVYQNPPKIFLDEDGRAAGLFAEVLAALAEDFGWRLDYRACGWAECLALLEQGALDVMPDVAHSESRSDRFRFGSVPVLYGWSYIYSRSGTVIQALADLQGRTVAVLDGSIQARGLAELRARWPFDILGTESHLQSLEAVADGRAELAIVNQFFGEPREEEFGLVRSQIVFQPVALYLAFADSVDDQLVAAVDARIAAMKSEPDSAYFTAHQRWLATSRPAGLPEWILWALAAALAFLLATLAVSALLKRRVDRATAALRRSQDQLIAAQLLASVGDFVWHVRTGRVEWSPGMRALLGYGPEESIDIDDVAQRVHHPEDAEWVWQWIQDGIASGADSLGPQSYRLCRKDGAVVFVETNLRLERVQGSVERVFGTCHDITAQVRGAEALRAAKQEAERASRAKSDFLASMSHELRTPLNAIIGFSELLHRDAGGRLSPRDRRQLDAIRAAGEQLLGLVDGVLDLSSTEAGQFGVSPGPTDARAVVRESVEQVSLMALERGVSIEDRLAAGETPLLWADHSRLKQVLLNFLTNAIKYNRPGGRVTLAQEAAADGFARLSVADTGIGVPPGNEQRIFELFSRAHGSPYVAHGGAGVGLAVAKRLVEAMGGRIGFESRPDAGSVFWCELPLAETDTAGSAERRQP